MRPLAKHALEALRATCLQPDKLVDLRKSAEELAPLSDRDLICLWEAFSKDYCARWLNITPSWIYAFHGWIFEKGDS